MTRRLHLTILAFLVCLAASAQTAPKAVAFRAVCDTIQIKMQQRTTVVQDVRMTKVMKRGKSLDLYFTDDLSYFPWHQEDIQWFRDQLVGSWDSVAKGFSLGKIYTNGYELSELGMPVLGSDGKPYGYDDRIADPRKSTPRFIQQVGGMQFNKGLSDRYIALWQSHGRYYDDAEGVWMWQRARVHRTVEDMYTQSYVIPFLIPMLENAGAYVMTPRERDTNWREIITDNDESFSHKREGRLRTEGVYSEKGAWEDAGEGFADFKEVYTFEDNPFTAGTARQTECTPKKATCVATWTPQVDERGKYAVYISYKSLKNSSQTARYTVHHMGGTTAFKVNQKRGGGTWIYLGTFEFDKGHEGYITLDNRGRKGEVVTADAVKVGGGMGKLARGGQISGMPSFAEGAHYWMQWAGVSTDITRHWDTDYTNDYATRGAWTVMMKDEKEIPFDLSLAFHTDAGLTQNDSIIGTLAIYTLKSDGKRKFDNGMDRIAGRVLCDYVQSQIVSDLRQDFVPDWSRRGLWDKNYSETRTTGVPAMILELLSHQNFADMKCGLDPSFRFTVCRAVYKGILKTISELYGCEYVVQPLPVNTFAVRFGSNGKAHLSWKATKDEKEPTAVPEGYIVYSRKDDGAFDKGMVVKGTSVDMDIENGHVYSYRVEAYNAGGRSFPSGTLAIGRPGPSASINPEVLIVDNFDRVSAPAWFDTPTYAGFDGRIDSGVPYINDISYIGENFEFNRAMEFTDNDSPGFGATYDDHAGEIVAGNTFDWSYVHGKTLLSLGYPFYSVSMKAFIASGDKAPLADIICGKQGRTKTGVGTKPDRFEVFPDAFQNALRKFTADGGNIFVSGSNVASDLKGSKGADFLTSLFGARLANQFGTNSGSIAGMEFYNKINPDVYCVERPDGLKSSGKGKVWLRYPGSAYAGAMYFKGENFKTILMGVPVETLKNESDRSYVLGAAMKYLSGESNAPELRK